MIEHATEILTGAAVVPLVAGAFWLGRRRKTVYVPPGEEPKLASQWEFTDENGKPTGEIIPAGTDPHIATQERSAREGRSYGARERKR